MTLQSSGPIAVSDVNTEVGLASTYSSSLSFLNDKVKPSIRPTQPNMNIFYGTAYFQNTTEGNCNNDNAAGVNCDCGNINCSTTANCTAVDCLNCDAQPYLQTNCNCGTTYNCTADQNCFSYNCNCNCACGKIICTKLYQLGLLPRDIFEADQAYGELLKVKHPDVYNGYIAWAQIVVDWMNGDGPNMLPWLPEVESRKRFKNFAIRWATDIATPWAEYMAYKMGARKETNKIGHVLMLAGTGICKVVNLWQSIFGKSKKAPGFGTGCMMMFIFISLKIIIETGNLFSKKNESLVRGQV